jgi:chondroitin-sulfate-ABC endolyase/exolyase
MKLKLFFIIFLCFSIFVTAQKMTSISFPGNMGSCLVQFSSTGTDKSSATLGNCWVLSNGSESVNNLAVTAIFENLSTEYGKLMDPTQMPSDYTNPQLVYSQMFSKSTDIGLAKWRKTLVTINQLTPSDLPIVVANTGITQAGYSFAAEPIGGSTYAVQLHTNNNAAYFACNQPAYELKFQLEHSVTSIPTSNGKIYVEGSSDLDVWEAIDTLAIYNDGSKTDHIIDIPNLSHRYFRLRIDDLGDSRSSRKINLRSAQVIPYPSEGNPYTFESLPPEWTSYQGGTIEQSGAHYKHLNNSLKWSWVPGSSLRVTKPIGIDKAPGMCYWIYNETPSTTPMKFNLYKNGILIKSFDYDINFKGWRSFWYLFSGDGGIALANNPDMIELKSSSAINSGTLFIDCVSFSSVVTWERMKDFHMSTVNQSTSVNDVLGIYKTIRPTATVPPSTSEQAAIDLISKRWEDFLLGSNKYVQNTQMIQKMNAVNNYIQNCKTNFNKYKISRQIDGSVSGVGLFNDQGGFSPKFTDINQDGIMGIALDYRLNSDLTSKQKALDTFDHYIDQGWAAGSSMGSVRFETLRFEGFCHSLFLLRKELAVAGNIGYQEKLKALYWMSLAGNLFQTGQRLGENTDDIRSSTVGILAYVLMENDPAKQLQAIKAFQKYINNALSITEDAGDMIKPDGSAYHHEFAYNSEYAPQGLYQGALYYYLFRDTPFALSDQTYNNLKMVLKKWDLHSSNLGFPTSTGGRFPSSGAGMAHMVGAYAFLAMAKPTDIEMTAMAKRMCKLDNGSVIDNYVNTFSTRITHINSIGALETMIDLNALPTTAAAEPQGSDYMPFSGMLLSRNNGWLVAIKGCSKYIVDYEFIGIDNYFGRYLSNDHIQIWNENRNLNSCTLSNSWDWSRFPGTTAKYLPTDVLAFNASRGDKERNYSTDYFLGGSVLSNKVSMFSNRLLDANDSSFRANKSNFIFEDIIVSLGTNITDSDSAYNIETNLFQDLQNGTTPQINGSNWSTTRSVSLKNSTANTVLKNCWGNTYVIYPYGGGSLEIRRQTQTTKNANNISVPPANYDVAYINHGIAPSNAGYRYITILGGNTSKTNLLAGASTPVEIIQQDNNAHIVRQNQLKITAYSVFATNASLTNGIVESSIRPFVGMIQENTDGTVDLALSDPDLNRPSGGMTSNVQLNITLRGNYELVEGNSGLTCTKLTGKFTISQTCKNGATYKIKLKNLDIPVRWTGAVSNSWNTGGNWSTGTVPTSTDNIVIDSNTANSTVLDTNFTLAAGKTLTISGTGTLTIDPTSRLTIAGYADFGGKPVILKSTNLGTATIGQVTGTLTGATNVTVERYIPAKRAWRAITAPLKGLNNSSVYTSWMNNNQSGVSDATGMLVFGPTTNWGIQMAQNYNLLTYNANDSWSGVTMPNNSGTLFSSTINNAFMAFITGPFGSSNITSGATATTLKANGELITGTQIYSTLSASEYKFLGNPYASPISPSAVLAGNSNFSNIWVWDPQLASHGAYVVYSGSAYSNVSGSYTAGQPIQSGQAFFVKPNTTSNFIIAENHKSTTVDNGLFDKTIISSKVLETPSKILRVNLLKQLENNWHPFDAVMALFHENASNTLDAQDAVKMFNPNNNITIQNNGISLMAEHRALPVLQDALQLRVNDIEAGANYKLAICTEDFSNIDLTARLVDLVTNTSVPITLNGTVTEYNFVTSAAQNTADRFRIVFETLLSNDALTSNVINVFPNPLTGSNFQIHFENIPFGNYKYAIINTLGQVVDHGNINLMDHLNNTLTPNSTLQGGIYILKLVDEQNKNYSIKLLIQQ